MTRLPVVKKTQIMMLDNTAFILQIWTDDWYATAPEAEFIFTPPQIEILKRELGLGNAERMK